MKKALLALFFSALLLAAANAVSQWDCDEHTRAYWKLDETNGNAIIDACPTPLGDNGGYRTAAGFGQPIGGTGSALFTGAFSGANATNVSMNYGVSQLTIEAWVNSTDNSTYRFISIDGNGNCQAFYFDGAKMACDMRNGTATITVTAGHLPTNVNLHFACQANGTHLGLWVDDGNGNMKELKNASFTGITTNQNPKVIYCFGAYSGDRTKCDGNFWKGTIDEYRVSTITRYGSGAYEPPPPTTSITVTNVRPHNAETNTTATTLFSYYYNADLKNNEYVTAIRFITNSTVEATNSTPIANNTISTFSKTFPYFNQTVKWYIAVETNSTAVFNSSEYTYYYVAAPTTIAVTNVYPHNAETNSTLNVPFTYQYAADLQNNEYVTAVSLILNSTVETTNSTAILNNTIYDFTKTFPFLNQTIAWYVSVETNSSVSFNSTEYTYNINVSHMDITLLNPLNNTLNNTIPQAFSFHYNGVDTATERITAIQLLFNSSVKATNSTPVSEGAVGTLTYSFTPETQETVNWSIRIQTNNSETFSSEVRRFRFDGIAPVISGVFPTNGLVVTDRNMTISGTITDTNLRTVNITVLSGASIVYNLTRWSVSSPFTFRENVDLSAYVTGGVPNYFVLRIEAADDHNAISTMQTAERELKNRDVKEPKTKADVEKKQFASENNLWNVTITLISAQALDEITSEWDAKKKQQSFTFKNKEKDGLWKVYEFRIDGQAGDNLQAAQASKHAGHVYAPYKYYVDFNMDEEAEHTTTCYPSYCIVKIVTKANSLKFKTIGGVNVVSEEYAFTLVPALSNTLPNAVFTSITQLENYFYNASAYYVKFNGTAVLIVSDGTAWSKYYTDIDGLEGKAVAAYWRISHYGGSGAEHVMGLFADGATQDGSTKLPASSLWLEIVNNNVFKLKAKYANGTEFTILHKEDCNGFQGDSTYADWDVNFKYNTTSHKIEARFGANNGTAGGTCFINSELNSSVYAILGDNKVRTFFSGINAEAVYWAASYIPSEYMIDVAVTWTSPVYNTPIQFTITNDTTLGSNYNLSFGDGAYSSNSLTATHTYPSLGTYLVCVNYTDFLDTFRQQCEILNVLKWYVRAYNEYTLEQLVFNVTFSNSTHTFNYYDQTVFSTPDDFLHGEITTLISKGGFFDFIPHTYFHTNSHYAGYGLDAYIPPAGYVYSTPVTVQIVNLDLNPVNQATVKFYRNIGGTSTLINEVKTGTTGIATHYFLVGTTYDIHASKLGVGSGTALGQAYTSEVITIVIGTAEAGYTLTGLNDTFYAIITPTGTNKILNNSVGFLVFDPRNTIASCGYNLTNASGIVVFTDTQLCNASWGVTAVRSPKGWPLKYAPLSPIKVTLFWEFADGTRGTKTVTYYWGQPTLVSAFGTIEYFGQYVFDPAARFWIIFLTACGVAASGAKLAGKKVALFGAVAVLGAGALTGWIDGLWFALAFALALIVSSQERGEPNG